MVTGNPVGQRAADASSKPEADDDPPGPGTPGDAEPRGPGTPGDAGLATQTVIEATTGAPLAAFPQRAPLAMPTVGGPSATGITRTGSPSSGSAWADPDATTPADGSAASAQAGTAGGKLAPDDEQAEDFWLPIEEVHWDGTPVTPTPRRWLRRDRTAAAGGTRATRRRTRGLRHPLPGLIGLLLLAFLGSFFAWVSAEPLWLAFGYGDRGTATVVSCTGSGLGQQCRGEFTAASGSFTAWDVRLAGVEPVGRAPGSAAPARMIGAESHTAYVGTGRGSLHLRWTLGLTLVLLCGVGIGWVTGALRLPGRWPRRIAVLASLAGPLLMTVGFLTAAFWSSRSP